MNEWSKSILIIGSQAEQSSYIESHFQNGPKEWAEVDIKQCIDVLWLNLYEESGGVDLLRQSLGLLRMRPRQMSHRCAIIQGAECLTRAMANSLLKILEEPPEKTFFILSANHQDRVLETIRSRVHVINVSNSEPVISKDWLHYFQGYMHGKMTKEQLLDEMISDEAYEYHQALGYIIYRLARLNFSSEFWQHYNTWLDLARQIQSQIVWNKTNLATAHLLLLNQVRKVVLMSA